MLLPTDTTDFTPIIIEVMGGRWDAFGPTTPRSLSLIETLKGMGGVSDSVPEGTYDFNVLDVNGISVASLTPHLN